MADLRMTRKGLLAGTAAAAGSAMLASRPVAAARPANVAGPVVDAHGHAVTPTVERLLAARGSRRLDGRDLPTWDVDAALAFQARQGIRLQVLVTPDPGLALAAPADHPAVARAVNDDLAAAVNAAPGRFGALAVLPLRAGTRAALAELRRALDGLGLDGVVLPTRVGDRSLGEAGLTPVFAELSRRGATALVHPVAAAARPEMPGTPADTVEHAFELVRCAAGLLYTGALLRAPRMRLVLGSGGGGLPFVASRIAIADQALRSDVFVRPLRRLSFDTAQSTDPAALASLRAFVRSPRQILYGSDWPLAAEQQPGTWLADLPKDERGIAGAAALDAFPSLTRRLGAAE